MADSEGRAVTELIREAVKGFLGRPVHERNVFNLSSSSAEGVTRVYPRLRESDWDALTAISRETGKCRTDLVREAVNEYLGIAV